MKKIIALAALGVFSTTTIVPALALAYTDAETGITNDMNGMRIKGDAEASMSLEGVPSEGDVTTGKLFEGKRGTGEVRPALQGREGMAGSVDSNESNGGRGPEAMIDARIRMLQNAEARLEGANYISSDTKATISTNIDAAIKSLTDLKATVGTGTAAGDVKSSARVYALVLPQAAILAATDRQLALVSQMETMGKKLRARIDAEKAKGTDVRASEAAYADFTANVASAEASANAAAKAVAGIKNTNDEASFKATLAIMKGAREDVRAAHASLVDARKDVNVILKGINVKIEADMKANGPEKAR